MGFLCRNSLEEKALWQGKSLKPLMLSSREFCRVEDQGLSSQHHSEIPGYLWGSGAGESVVRGGELQREIAAGREASVHFPRWLCLTQEKKPFEMARDVARSHTKHASQTPVTGKEPGGRLGMKLSLGSRVHFILSAEV